MKNLYYYLFNVQKYKKFDAFKFIKTKTLPIRSSLREYIENLIGKDLLSIQLSYLGRPCKLNDSNDNLPCIPIDLEKQLKILPQWYLLQEFGIEIF